MYSAEAEMTSICFKLGMVYMYFWKIEKLKEDIRQDRLTEKDKFLYMLVSVVIYAILFEILAYMPAENSNQWDYIESIGNILLALLGTIFVFRANGGSQGRDFLGRYFALSLVVSIRFLVYSLPLFVLYVGLFTAVNENEAVSATTYVDVASIFLWTVAMYWRICVHIKQASVQKAL